MSKYIVLKPGPKFDMYTNAEIANMICFATKVTNHYANYVVGALRECGIFTMDAGGINMDNFDQSMIEICNASKKRPVKMPTVKTGMYGGVYLVFDNNDELEAFSVRYNINLPICCFGQHENAFRL